MRNIIEIATSYLSGLLKCEKNHTNMERIEEKISGQDPLRYYNFIGKSKWDQNEDNNLTAIGASALMESCKSRIDNPFGLVIDKTSL